MAKAILIVFIIFDMLFLCCGVLHLAIPLLTRMSDPHASSTSSWVAQHILLNTTPLTASMVNSVLIFAAFACSLPAIVFPSSRCGRRMLTLHAYLALAAAMFTLALGLIIWFSTLQSKANLAPVWTAQDPATQSLLQQKFACCGYSDSAAFVKDATCSSVATAARLGPCVNPFGQFADKFLDIVFTAFFGIVAVDVLLLMSGMCLMKERGEEVRYRLIDSKAGWI